MFIVWFVLFATMLALVVAVILLHPSLQLWSWWPKKTIAIITAILGVAILSLGIVKFEGFLATYNKQDTFNEWYNGWETQAVIETTQCERDGSCSYTYQCDMYIEEVEHCEYREVDSSTSYLIRAIGVEYALASDYDDYDWDYDDDEYDDPYWDLDYDDSDYDDSYDDYDYSDYEWDYDDDEYDDPYWDLDYNDSDYEDSYEYQDDANSYDDDFHNDHDDSTAPKMEEYCYTEKVERYHECPYVNTEYSYFVNTTLGRYTIDTDRFPDNPNSQRWRQDKEIPVEIIEDAGTGIPAFWQEVKDRIDNNNPGPVTKRMPYKNFILSSEHTVLRAYSDDVEEYVNSGVMPKLTHSTKYIPSSRSSYLADKVYFIGLNPEDERGWNDSLGRLNAAFGSELQGDLHLVIADDSLIDNIDQYKFALNAYWQDQEVFGQDVLSKNAVVAIMTVKDGRVVKSRVFTGMPMGNEDVVLVLQNRLVNQTLDPATIIGTVSGVRFGDAVHGTGIIESVLWGLNGETTHFERVCMECVEEGGSGFNYLKVENRPLTSGVMIFLIIFNLFLVAVVAWFIFGEQITDRYYRYRDF